MNNIFDYVKNFESKTFDEMQLNEIDNVIFSRLSYLNFDGFEGKTIEYIAEHFPYTTEKENLLNKVNVKTEDLLMLIGTSKRFKNVSLCEFIENSDNINDTALSATTFKISDNLIYIAFRGTDEKIISIYEDAELAYAFPTPAQFASLSYTNYLLTKYSDCNFILGGHSKGGNLAMFSFLFISEVFKKRIVSVYNNDGPGFPKGIAELMLENDEENKIINLFPEDSIIGRMLEQCGKTIIIKSGTAAVAQHNLFTWKVYGDKFERTDNFSMLSNYIDDTLTESLKAISSDDLKKAVQSVYKVTKRSGLYSLEDFNKSNYSTIVQSVLHSVATGESIKNEAGEIVKTLSKSMINSVDIDKRLPDIDIDRVKEFIETIKKKREEKSNSESNDNE